MLAFVSLFPNLIYYFSSSPNNLISWCGNLPNVHDISLCEGVWISLLVHYMHIFITLLVIIIFHVIVTHTYVSVFLFLGLTGKVGSAIAS